MKPALKPSMRNCKARDNVALETALASLAPSLSLTFGIIVCRAIRILRAFCTGTKVDPGASIFDRLVLATEQSNAYKRRINAWRQDRRSRTATPGEVSDDEPEDPLPVLADFVDISNVAPPLFAPTAPPNTLATASTNVPSAAANPCLSRQPFLPPPAVPSADRTTAPSTDRTTMDWVSFLNNLQPGPPVLQHSPLMKVAIDWSALSPAFTSADAAANDDQMDPSSMPDALLRMMHMKSFIPLHADTLCDCQDTLQ